MWLGRYCCATPGVRRQLLDKRESDRQGGGILVDAAVGYDPQETDRNEHAQGERLSTVKVRQRSPASEEVFGALCYWIRRLPYDSSTFEVTSRAFNNTVVTRVLRKYLI